MFDSNINEEDIEVIDVYDDTVNDFGVNSAYKSNNDDINELIDLKNKLLIKGEYPNKDVTYDACFNVYRLSEPGTSDIYVSVNKSDKYGFYQIVPVDINDLMSSGDLNQSDSSSNEKGRSLTKSTLVGRAMAPKDDINQAAFTNILFFVFLSGLSIGVVLMVILNIFI